MYSSYVNCQRCSNAINSLSFIQLSFYFLSPSLSLSLSHFNFHITLFVRVFPKNNLEHTPGKHFRRLNFLRLRGDKATAVTLTFWNSCNVCFPSLSPSVFRKKFAQLLPEKFVHFEIFSLLSPSHCHFVLKTNPIHNRTTFQGSSFISLTL